jgi:hypothetical protein
MGIPDGAHTHGTGGSGLGTAVLVLVGAALAVKLAGPVVAAVGELVHVLVIVAVVIVGVGAMTATAYARCAWRSTRAAKTATTTDFEDGNRGGYAAGGGSRK